MSTNYAKGRRYEYRSIKLLEEAGYACIRSAGSHGVFDICAISPIDILLVQVKVGSGRLSSADLEVAKAFPAPPNVRKLIHHWQPKQRLPTIHQI